MTQDEKIKYFVKEIKEIIPGATTCLNKEQLAIVLNTSIASINRRIKDSYGIPPYVKGSSPKARLFFTVLDTAIFLADSDNKIKVA